MMNLKAIQKKLGVSRRAARILKYQLGKVCDASDVMIKDPRWQEGAARVLYEYDKYFVSLGESESPKIVIGYNKYNDYDYETKPNVIRTDYQITYDINIASRVKRLDRLDEEGRFNLGMSLHGLFLYGFHMYEIINIQIDTIQQNFIVRIYEET